MDKNRKVIKKTDYCSNCGLLDGNNFCRLGLGWKKIKEPKITYCSQQWPIRPKRCGTCVWYTTSQLCIVHHQFYNFYNYCPEYSQGKGQNIRPKDDNIPAQYDDKRGNSGKM